MDRIDSEGINLTKLQGKIFEESTNDKSISSLVFIRRFMYSNYCQDLDNKVYSSRITNALDALEEVIVEYGNSSYGSKILNKDKMYWIGYMYRYWAYVANVNSASIFKLVNGREMDKLYDAYHTFDPLYAIERILESKGMELNPTEEKMTIRGVEILRRLINKDKNNKE